MDLVFARYTLTLMNKSESLAVLVVLAMDDLPSPVADIALLVVGSALSYASISVARIVPSFDSFLSLNLNDLMMEVLYLLKSKWQLIQSALVIAICTSFLRNVDIPFYKTQKNA